MADSGTNLSPAPLPAFPDAGVSLLRVLGALFLVIGLFVGGAWLYRNSQRFMVRRGRAPKLSVLETRSLGNRQALVVVGYERQRMLLSASPAGVSLLTHLPESGEEPGSEAPPPAPSFTEALQQVLSRK